MIAITNQDLFVNAFLEAEQISNTEYIKKENYTFEFSHKFEKRMQKLITKENKIKFSTRRKISKALLAAIIAIIIMLTGLMSVSASRKKIIDFIETIFPKYTQIELSDDSSPTLSNIKTAYTLSYVPDGFELDQYNQDEVSVFAIWKNRNEEEIVFYQILLDSNISVDTEHVYEVTELNGYKAYLYGQKDTFFINWSDGVYCYRLSVPAECKDDLIDMAKKIIENK